MKGRKYFVAFYGDHSKECYSFVFEDLEKALAYCKELDFHGHEYTLQARRFGKEAKA